MNHEIAQHFASIVKGEFPKHADIAPREEGGDLCLYVDWHLRTDPARPNRRSKMILVRITREVMSDYSNGDEHQRRQSDALLKEFLSARLVALDPEPVAPAHIASQPEEWLVYAGTINL